MANLNIVESAVKNTVKRHKEKFQTFLKNWYGWEKWFQVELAHELSAEGEAYVEKQYAYDKKKKLPIGKLNNLNAFVDVIFRKRNDTKDYFSAIELTVGCTKQSLRKVLSDLFKIRAIKQSDWQFRSVFVILVYDGKYERNTKYAKLLERIHEEFEAKSINCGDFSFVIFGWEPPNNKVNMIGQNYNKWFKSLDKLYAEFDIRPKVSTKKLLANKEAME